MVYHLEPGMVLIQLVGETKLDIAPIALSCSLLGTAPTLP